MNSVIGRLLLARSTFLSWATRANFSLSNFEVVSLTIRILWCISRCHFRTTKFPFYSRDQIETSFSSVTHFFLHLSSFLLLFILWITPAGSTSPGNWCTVFSPFSCEYNPKITMGMRFFQQILLENIPYLPLVECSICRFPDIIEDTEEDLLAKEITFNNYGYWAKSHSGH